jgi:hypothetical protein
MCIGKLDSGVELMMEEHVLKLDGYAIILMVVLRSLGHSYLIYFVLCFRINILLR